jgi:predicted AlkP superfamily pyrophosphatase or phosphodiesterase
MFFVVACVVVLLLAASVAMAAKPTRVLIITMDQMKPWYAEQYGMTNMLWLQNNGVNFDKAYVGQMASETVVSHNTMVSGLFPKHMGWSDEVMRLVRPLTKVDVNGQPTGQFYPAGSIVTVGDLSYVQYQQLIEDLDYPKLGDYMHQAFPDKIVANFGEKKYQVNSTAASSSDYWAYMGAKFTNSDPTFLPWLGKYRVPEGNLPSYIASDKRFLISSGNASDAYGSTSAAPSFLYPEDGRYAPGPYPTNLSGDAWVADAAIKVMEDPDSDWSAMHLNFSGIDKIGHMWGGGPVDTVAWDPTNLMTEIHMTFIAKNADDQLGKLIRRLDQLGQLKETLIVVTADHASTYAEKPHYVNVSGGGDQSWYYDPNNVAANTTYGRSGFNNAAVLAPLNATSNVAYSYQSTAIETWLIDQSWTKKLACADVMRTLPDVIATYARDGDKYVLISQSATMTASERAWWTERGQELVDTMAFAGAADVVGLLADRTSYGVYGDHGGAQKDVQSVPMVFYTPGMKHLVRGTKFRTVDIMPTVLRTMGIAPTAPMDGTAYNLPIK